MNNSSTSPALPPLPRPARSAQYLPVPLGSLAPAHGTTRNAWPWRAVAPAAAGCVAAALALAVTLAPQQLAVDAAPGRIDLGGSTLLRQPRSPVAGYALYTGDVAMLVSARSATLTAVAVSTINGVPASGRCFRVGGDNGTADIVEACTFRVGGDVLSAIDVYSASSRVWQRRYSDGRTTSFSVPIGAEVIPIPLPLGR